MQIEYEATFYPVKKDDVRRRARKAKAILVRPEFLQKRVTFKFPHGHDIEGGWLRIRDEGDKITMSLKVVRGEKITDQKEICLTVDDYAKAEELLAALGCQKKAYQETKREIWQLDGVEITIDEWPFLEPFVEIEGNSEAAVKMVSERLGFDFSQAKFCAIGYLYKLKYGIALDEINNHTPKIIFEMDNPFQKN